MKRPEAFNQEEVIEAIFAADNVYCDPLHPLKGGAGFYQPIYLDHRKILSHVSSREIVFKAMTSLLPPLREYDLLAGNETAGIAFAGFLAQLNRTPMVYVRKESKKSGTQRQVEGFLGPENRVVLIDDMMVTGGNVERAVQALRGEGARVSTVVVISVVDAELVMRRLGQLNVELKYLVTFREIVDWGAAHNKFTDQQLSSVKDYLNDPVRWDAQHGFA